LRQVTGAVVCLDKPAGHTVGTALCHRRWFAQPVGLRNFAAVVDCRLSIDRSIEAQPG